MNFLASFKSLRVLWLALSSMASAFTVSLVDVTVAAGQEIDDGSGFQRIIAPYLKAHCQECHNSQEAKGELDVTSYKSDQDVIAQFRQWKHILDFVREGEMPPEDSPQPSITESNAMIHAVEAIMLVEAKKFAGDPGVILPRRLSNTEYDRSIRDLTGIDIRPTRHFPADPAGGEGFDNTGEALRMSPSLLKKYLGAAQQVADHLVLKPEGIFFAPFPVTSYNERKKLTEQAVIDFYEAHEVSISDYVESAWRFRFHQKSGGATTLEAWAKQQQLSPRYLQQVWDYFQSTDLQEIWLSDVQSHWAALSEPVSAKGQPQELQELVRSIERWKRVLFPEEPELIRSNAGNWPISHLDFRSQIAAQRDRFDPASLKAQRFLKVGRISKPDVNSSAKLPAIYLDFEVGYGSDGSEVILRNPIWSQGDQYPRNEEEREKQKVTSMLAVLQQIYTEQEMATVLAQSGVRLEEEGTVWRVTAPGRVEIPLNESTWQQLGGMNFLADIQLSEASSASGIWVESGWVDERGHDHSQAEQLLFDPSSSKLEELQREASAFCETFPNRFFYVNSSRGLAAGFHLVEGFFRDDQPLVEKVLTAEEKNELNRLWNELNFVTQSTETLLRGFVWFERSEREVLHDQRFDWLRSEDPELVQEEYLIRFEKLYLDRLGVKRLGDSLEPMDPDPKFDMIHSFFESIRQGLDQYKTELAIAEQRGREDLWRLAERAYRRPLEEHEIQALDRLYGKLRNEGQGPESAMRGLLTAILMAPDFSYQFFESPTEAGRVLIGDYDLASRLSYFVWSSLPDAELLDAANRGALQDPEQVVLHTKRMLHDDRVRAFAEEFFGQWLRYRDFEEKDPIDGEAFPEYTQELREAFAEEPIRLATYLIQNDQPITRLLDSDITFLNEPLARHYGGKLEQAYRVAANAAKSEATGSGDSQDLWCQVEGLSAEGRGGWLGMAVVLAKNSAGQRTSPVKRGFWTVHHLLGQHFPPPPAQVPELPASEKHATATLRELLAAHVADSQCAMCHKHFDGLGLALEGFDPIGRARIQDDGGRSIEIQATLPNGQIAEGISGLIEYIKTERQQEFVQNLCRKFLGYALGRSVSLSDQILLDEMEQTLVENDYRFSVLFEVVVRSPQFRYQRGRNEVMNR
jgi:hypothetical protein